LGHNRLGRLPKTRRWVEVVELLDTAPEQTSAVASAVVEAADNRLRQLADDPALTYCFWLLTRITWAARGPGFLDDLSRLGIDAAPHSSALTLISQVTDRVREELSSYPSSGHFAEISSLSLRHALSETVGQQGPSLFDSSVEDAQRAFRTYSTRAGFGELAHRFFSDFLARTLRSFVDRELSNHIGGTSRLASVNQSLDFMQALDTHTRQSARIAEEFAGGWYSKHNWESKGEIARDEAQRFVANALRKLRTELKREAAGA
jgi:hypothetical protein